MKRRQNFQTIAWFNDLRQRSLLDLDPPYQRRSVWTQRFKDYFVETVLLNYPAPAIFLFEEISPDGRSMHHVVDGKQRLTALFEFIDGVFPVAEDSSASEVGGLYFASFTDDRKKAFWSYQFLVEYVPKDDDKLIENIFDRINRNVAKLTPQELRHAKLDGRFISAAERLAAWMREVLPTNFPRLAPQSFKQMKDIEMVATLLLLAEHGPRSLSQSDLDDAFTKRDEDWEDETRVDKEFRAAIEYVAMLLKADVGVDLTATRFRNQTDFYSLMGAVLELAREGQLPDPAHGAKRLADLMEGLEDPARLEKSDDVKAYHAATRSASNDKGPRESRIRVAKRALKGELT